MPKVRYGDRVIEYSIEVKNDLTSHYIVVDKHHGVILRGSPIFEELANKYILKKARWILKKLDLVRFAIEDGTVTGSRILYLGKKYYTVYNFDESFQDTKITFNYSRFIITTSGKDTRENIGQALDDFFREKASEKITPRVEMWSKKTGISYGILHFRKQTKRWGSCTPRNNIVINTEAVRLPYSLIDYLIVHELCHVKFKNHSKDFWSEVGKHLRNYKELDERMQGMKI